MGSDSCAKVIDMEDESFDELDQSKDNVFELLEKKKIFVIDDDPMIQELATMFLKDIFEVIVLKNPSEVVSKTIKENPYVILLDLHMPNIDGFEVLRMLKSHPFTYDVPVICMSSDLTNETRTRVNKLGGVGIVGKPLAPATLAKDISAMANSLNTNFVDKDNRVHVHMFYSGREKESVIKRVIEESAKNGEKVIVLSWLLNKMFEKDPSLKKLLESEDVMLFLIKNSLNMRLPYLQDLSVVFSDLEALMGSEGNNVHLIIDEIKPFFLTSKKEEVFNKLLLLTEYFKASFEKVSIFNTRSSKREITDLVHEFVREFVGTI